MVEQIVDRIKFYLWVAKRIKFLNKSSRYNEQANRFVHDFIHRFERCSIFNEGSQLSEQDTQFALKVNCNLSEDGSIKQIMVGFSTNPYKQFCKDSFHDLKDENKVPQLVFERTVDNDQKLSSGYNLCYYMESYGVDEQCKVIFNDCRPSYYNCYKLEKLFVVLDREDKDQVTFPRKFHHQQSGDFTYMIQILTRTM